MRRSQKAYTIDQYNKARARRNLPPIPNPFRDGGATATLQAGTALAKKFPSFIGVETVTPVSTKTKVQYPKGEKAPNPILDFSDEELTALFETPSFQRLIDNLESSATTTTTSSSISDPLNTPGTSGVTTTKSTTPRTKADVSDESPFKKPKYTSTPLKTTDMGDKSYVGSGHGTDMDLGDPLNETTRTSSGLATGGAAASLAIEKGDIIPDVPRPYNFKMSDGFGRITNAFSVLSYGFATRILPHPGNPTPITTATAHVVLATTPLLEIPWDRVHMYINPGVYDSLPIGSYVKSVHCKVIQRNIRVAFETAASDTTLATLNQNKFTVLGFGLNNKNDLRTSNMRYSVSGTASAMVPTGLSDPNYDDIDECLYGYPQSVPAFNGVLSPTVGNPYGVPCNNFSFNTVLHPKNYLVAWNYGYKAPGETDNVKDRGWYNLSTHIRKCPTGKVIDQEIVNQSYYPTYAPLKGQLEFAEYLRDNIQINPPTGTTKVLVNLNNVNFTDHDIGKQFDGTQIGISAESNSNPTEAQVQVNTNRNAYSLLVGRKSMIEKGQYYKQIDSNANGKYVQPSIHVGVASVPKLTTSTNEMVPTEFTDVQAYYDVELSMIIGFNYAHQNTYQDVFNVNANEIRMSYDTSVTGQRPTNLLPNRFGHQAIY